MLSAYMRFKYPNMVTGSIAASAPVNLLTQSVDRSFFFAAVTKDFSTATPNCESKVKQAFIIMMDTAAKGASGNTFYKWKLLKVCTRFVLKNHPTATYQCINAENSSTGCMSILCRFHKLLWYCSILFYFESLNQSGQLWNKEKITIFLLV